MKTWKLENNYSIRTIPDEEFYPLFRKLRDKLFSKTITFNVQEALSVAESEAAKTLQKNMGTPYKLNLGLYHHDELVGWSFGWQENQEKFYMVNSAVFPEHRKKGLYRALMSRMVEEATAQGFQVIYSRHTASNSAILIPKLKFGFIISGVEISDMFGTLVHLSYFTNPIRRKAMDFRTGEVRPDNELKKYLSL